MNSSGSRVVIADVLSEFLEVAIHLILYVRGIYPPELFESTQKYGCPLKTARHPGLTQYIQQVIKSIRTELIKDTIHRIGVVTLDPSGKGIDRFVFEMSMLRPFEEDLVYSNDDMKTERSLPRKDITGKGKGRAINQDLDTSMDWKEDSGGHRYAYGSDNGGNDEEPLKRNSIAHRMRLQEQEQQHRIQSAKDRPRFGGLMTLTADVEALLRAMLLKISVSRADLPLTSSDEELSFTVVVETKIESSGPEAKPDFPWSPISASVLAEQTKISPQPATPSPHRKIIPVKTIDISSIQLELYIERL